MSFVTFRQSIRWLPDPPSEPTHTVVLTGPSGVFVDIRFLKDTPDRIDWAFAGYRTEVSPNVVQFKHHIDSRTNEPLSVVDMGTNSTIRPGITLEIGEMVNPETGKMTPYEEIWEDSELDCEPESPNHNASNATSPARALFIRNLSGTVWRARVNQWQLSLGRDAEGRFWAWQAAKQPGTAAKSAGEWDVVYSTGDKSTVRLLSEESEGWRKGEEKAWDGDKWVVLDAEG